MTKTAATATPSDDKATTPGLLTRYRQRYPWLDHLVRAAQSYTAHHGDHYAAAITYFSVLSLVPLMMIVFAGAAFVLAGNDQLLTQLQTEIKAAVPSDLGDTLNDVVNEAIAARGSVGILGLLLALYSGLGWMANLRNALTAQWESVPGESAPKESPPGQSAPEQSAPEQSAPEQQPRKQEGFLRTKMVDMLALLGLGAALLLSFAITGAGTAFADVLMDLAGLGDVFGVRVVFYVLALALSLLGMWLVFLWVIARLPRASVTLRSAMRAAVIAALGFEVLKQVFAVYLDSVTTSPTGRLFGPVIGLMVFAFFVSRFLLFTTAWAATARENRR